MPPFLTVSDEEATGSTHDSSARTLCLGVGVLPTPSVPKWDLSQLFTWWRFRYAARLIARWRSGGMIDFKGSQMEVMHGIRKGQLTSTGKALQTPAEQFYALAA